MGGKIRYGVGMLSSTPHNTTKAVVNDWREVKNARVAELKDASYRDSVFSGVFEVADKKDPFFEGVDGLKLEIKVHWYGRRPPSRWATAFTHLQLRSRSIFDSIPSKIREKADDADFAGTVWRPPP